MARSTTTTTEARGIQGQDMGGTITRTMGIKRRVTSTLRKSLNPEITAPTTTITKRGITTRNTITQTTTTTTKEAATIKAKVETTSITTTTTGADMAVGVTAIIRIIIGITLTTEEATIGVVKGTNKEVDTMTSTMEEGDDMDNTINNRVVTEAGVAMAAGREVTGEVKEATEVVIENECV